MTSAAPIPLDKSDIAWLEARNPRSEIDAMFACGRFVNVEEKDGVSYGSNSNKRD
jgi:hypothetical protein